MHTTHGLFNAKYIAAGDYEMWLRAVQGGAQFMKINGTYGLFYDGGQGLTTGKRAEELHKECIEIASIYHKPMFGTGYVDRDHPETVRLKE